MIGIYTRSTSYFSKELWKWTAKRLVNKYTGPNAVEDSLLRGLKELNIPFVRNSNYGHIDVDLVLSGTRALQESIARKKNGQIKKLMAGPNIVAHPHDANNLTCNDLIDVILVPSEWVANFWSNEAPELKSKIRVWFAGVPTSPASTRVGQPIIYDKIGSRNLVAKVEAIIGTSVQKFTYGSFKRQDYLSALRDAPFMIYLSESESQGLALQEAWAHNVPTLVNKSTNWKNGQMSWEAEQINCPYLTPELGAIFDTPEQIPSLITSVSKLNPKPYCDQYLSDRVSVQTLMKLL